MSTILDQIAADTRRHVEECRSRLSLADITAAARNMPTTRGFISAIKKTVDSGRYALIAEIKKASPSAGLIRDDFDPMSLAEDYYRAGASCLSILTDRPHFQGHDLYLQQARATVPLPCLRKDFMIDAYQVYEARTLGADCILLIMALLDDPLAADLEGIAHELGMDVLIETHDEAEMERALRLRSPLIGINNRNLKVMKTDLSTSEKLAALVPANRLLVSESGLKETADLERMAAVGINCFLVGESLMRQADVKAATKKLLGL